MTVTIMDYIKDNYEIIYIHPNTKDLDLTEVILLGDDGSESDRKINGVFINNYITLRDFIFVQARQAGRAQGSPLPESLKYVVAGRKYSCWGEGLNSNDPDLEKRHEQNKSKKLGLSQILGIKFVDFAAKPLNTAESQDKLKDLIIEANQINIDYFKEEARILSEEVKTANEIFASRMDSIIANLKNIKNKNVKCVLIAPHHHLKSSEVSVRMLDDYLKSRQSLSLIPKKSVSEDTVERF